MNHKLGAEDLADLMPLMLVIRLAENPECTLEDAVGSIVRVVDRAVEATTA